MAVVAGDGCPEGVCEVDIDGVGACIVSSAWAQAGVGGFSFVNSGIANAKGPRSTSAALLSRSLALRSCQVVSCAAKTAPLQSRDSKPRLPELDPGR